MYALIFMSTYTTVGINALKSKSKEHFRSGKTLPLRLHSQPDLCFLFKFFIGLTLHGFLDDLNSRHLSLVLYHLLE